MNDPPDQGADRGAANQPAASSAQHRERALSPTACRALAEAEARRAKAQHDAEPQPKEFGGRAGLDPVRYGDWEIRGIASDF